MPEPLRPDLPGWDDYIAAARDHRAQLARKLRDEKERYERELAQFRQQKAERSASIAAQNWKGKGELLNAMRSVTAAEAKKVELEIRERHRREAKALRDARDAWPEYHDWLAKWFSPEDAGDYRYHRHEPLRLEGDGDNEALPRDLRAFTGEIVGSAVEYRRQGAAGGVSEEVSFTDHGRRIDVQEAHDEAATLAALQLGAAKWGKVSVYGSDAYMGQMASLTGEIDQAALRDIGRALRAEFIASGTDMLRLESDDGAELIVYAIEVRAIVMAATNIQLIDGDAHAQN